MGLDRLWPDVVGAHVLDVGCAEGLISLECAHRGAATVRGFEIREKAVEMAQSLRDSRMPDADVQFWPADANDFTPRSHAYDIVLLLAVLHKLRDPSAAVRRYANAAKSLVVIRLPPAAAPTIVDSRSKFVPHNIGRAMEASGFHLEHSDCTGPLGEWVGYYRRNS